MAILESFLHNIWGHGIFWWHKQAISESFLSEDHIFYQFVKDFSLTVSHYTVVPTLLAPLLMQIDTSLEQPTPQIVTTLNSSRIIESTKQITLPSNSSCR